MNPFIQLVKHLSNSLGGITSLNQTNPGKVAYLRNLERELQSRDVLDIPFDELPVVVFDLETTGFFPYTGDRILSIGAVKMIGTKIIESETFYSLIYCDSLLSEEVKELTGITQEMVEKAPSLRDVLKDFYRFIKSDVLVAHHAIHEQQFMRHATWLALRKSFQHRIVDTSFLTKIAYKEKQLVTLDECCKYYGITITQRHHALQDAMATALLWKENINEIQKMGYYSLKDVYIHLAKQG